MATTGSTAPMFSYAQAAKGLTPSTNARSTNSSSASSEHGSKEPAPTTETYPAQVKQKALPTFVDATPSKALPNGHYSSNKTEDDSHEKVNGDATTQELTGQEKPTRSEPENDLTLSKDTSAPSSSQEAKNTKDTSADRDAEKQNQNDDQEKPKDVDDDWEKVSVPSVTADKELKAAPIPAVNIWQQRKELLEAKNKELAGQRQSVAATSKPKLHSSPSREESKRRPAKETGLDKDTNAPKRNISGGRVQTSERKEQSPAHTSPRSSSKQNEKNGTTFTAPQDTASWPTPDSAVVDDRRRSVTQEKAEKPDAKFPNQKKWVQMPFVPTAKFETQLPPAATARRGGRASNRGRESSGRGGAAAANSAQNTDKADAATAGPNTSAKQPVDQDRGRKGENTRGQRSSSVPVKPRRSASSGDNFIVSNKPNVTQSKDQIEAESLRAEAQRNASLMMNESIPFDGPRAPTHYSGPDAGSVRPFVPEFMQMPPNQVPVGFEPVTHSSAQLNRNKAVPRDEPKSAIEAGDRSYIPGREWSRGRPESTREKGDSWREKREPRTERGRGGHRGRGNHNGYSNHSQTFTAPLPQNGFENTKSYSHEGKGRQTSQSFNPTQSSASGRNNPRSQSIPISAISNTYYSPAQGFPQALSPAQGDMTYGYNQGQLPSGIMNAMPYADPLNSMALMSMVVTQLEYYFSINNLCKDLFLRKNMDSQGFVPLSVISSFKRIRALTDGQMTSEQFRAVCQQVPNVEFVTTEDGEDRLRASGNWRNFILPIEERLPSAQNDGPVIRQPQRHRSAQAVHNMTSPNGSIRSPAALNGFTEPFLPSGQQAPYPPVPPFDGPVAEGYSMRGEQIIHDQGLRSPVTSPFGHVQSPPIPDSARSSAVMTNGHHRSTSMVASNENLFPDEKIPELKVVVRDPTYDLGHNETNSTPDVKAAKLRGGAGSPQQMDYFRPIQFGQSSPDTEDDLTPYMTKHGEMSKVPASPSFVHEDYLSLRGKAYSQLDNRHFDGALAVLYPFWSTFLVNNFNLSMYQDFSNLATEEAAAGSANGQTYLLSFYESLLKRKEAISERMSGEIVKMFRNERDLEQQGGKRPVFETLRKTLRNGATDFRTVKRVTDLLSMEEKTDLGV